MIRAKRRRAETRILVTDLSGEEPRACYVTKREANLYHRAYRRPAGAEVIALPSAFRAPWERKPRGAA